MVEAIYWGTREAMVAEVTAWDPAQIGVDLAECAYLIMPMGDAPYDTDWTATRDEAKKVAQELSGAWTGGEKVPVIFIS